MVSLPIFESPPTSQRVMVPDRSIEIFSAELVFGPVVQTSISNFEAL
jgi:hypothetical protein